MYYLLKRRCIILFAYDKFLNTYGLINTTQNELIKEYSKPMYNNSFEKLKTEEKNDTRTHIKEEDINFRGFN